MNRLSVDTIREYLSEIADGFNRDEGHQFGDVHKEVGTIMVCWMCDVAAIEHAISIHADLIITHESLFFPYDVVVNGQVPQFLTWPTNHRRIQLLASNGISVIRAHGTLDKFCIFDDFAAVLGLSDPVINEPNYVKIYDIEACTFQSMIERVKGATGMKNLRVTNGDRQREMTRVGLPWGGLGLFVNVSYVQKLIHHGCQLLIAGETDNYGLRFATDAGLEMIETSHEVSENPGLRHFAGVLSAEFPEARVVFYENQQAWSFA